MSTAAMLVYPEFFKVAVSSAGNHDNTIYNSWWSETHHGIKEEKDASAAAIVASALLDLSSLVEKQEDQKRYYNAAIKILKSLGSENYSAVGKADSFLLHSTGAKSLGHEIDVALIYADYYYIEALCRLKETQKNSAKK
jgi:unsaturated chondroitin disaccharide hydrolase